MRKILIVITTGMYPFGGLCTVMMNYFRKMNHEGLQIDFASTNLLGEELEKELESCHARYYCLGNRKRNCVSYLWKLCRLLKKERYDVVHVNGNSETMCLELMAARLNLVPARIAHVHAAEGQRRHLALKKCLAPMLKRCYTMALAVSKEAGKSLYGRNFLVMNNAIDIEKYRFSQESRDRLRKLLHIEDKFVVGNVGKLNAAKNHRQLLEIFKLLHDEKEQALLMLVGGGKLEHKLRSRCRELGIEDCVVFAGMKDNAWDYLQVFDVFVFTSLSEGLGMAVIEAQASGLDCIVSDAVPAETKVSGNITYLSLGLPAEAWSRAIQNAALPGSGRQEKSLEACESIKRHGYDINGEAVKLERLYRGQTEIA